MLEIACFNPASAVAAAAQGADRIELCADYSAGGVTVPHTWLLEIKGKTDKPINIMIRPRAGDFVYNREEFEQMKKDIQHFKSEASGFVFGILNADHRVDVNRNRELVDQASPLPCTFHRAIDQTPDITEAAEQIVSCGFSSILTSGGASDAMTGAPTIAHLQQAIGDRIAIIAGGGIRSANLKALGQQTRVNWYHSAAITKSGETVDEEEVARLQNALKSM